VFAIVRLIVSSEILHKTLKKRLSNSSKTVCVNGSDFIPKPFAAVNGYPGTDMASTRQREVVLEIEHVRVVRKRARTSLRSCRDCGRTTDFITLAEASELFSTTPAVLFEFSQSSVCHHRLEDESDLFLCLTSLLAAMSKKIKKGTVKLLGDSSNEENIF
jgi:hypothetical protein